MDYVTFIGTTGASLILVAFILEQIHRVKDTDLMYDIINFVGSGLLVIYAVLLRSYPFLILNMVWFLVSLRDVFIDLRRTSQVSQPTEAHHDS